MSEGVIGDLFGIVDSFVFLDRKFVENLLVLDVGRLEILGVLKLGFDFLIVDSGFEIEGLLR